jgi:galactokinase
VIDALRRRFRDQFGRAASAAARAPGRVNWIGEHTDYNDGLVLPCAIDRATWVAVAPRDDDRFRVVSREQPGAFEFAGGDLARRGDWVDYARAAVAALREAAAEIPGADLAIASEVPLGSGLSSSAALSVALVTALDAAFGLGLSAGDRAQRAHRAETAFVGVPCGIMDSRVSALAREGHLLRIDCRSGECLPVPLPEGRVCLLVFHSGTRRRLAAGAYAARRDECFRALRAARDAGIAPVSATALRDLDPAALPARERALAPELFRRARHVIRENARVDASCQALRRGDLEGAGALLREGMRSLRDDFEVSTPELDLLCELGDAAPGVFGSRLTGAGFGGCTLHAVAPEAAGAAALAIATGFERRTGRRPEWLRVAPGGGAAAVPIA